MMFECGDPGQSRASTQYIAKCLVFPGNTIATERFEKVDEAQVVVNKATCRQVNAIVFQISGELGEFAIARPQVCQSLWFVEKAPMVRDEIKYHQLVFAIPVA